MTLFEKYNMEIPSIQLKKLINSNKIDEAILLCKSQIQEGVGKIYYKYWLNKLIKSNAFYVDWGEGGAAADVVPDKDDQKELKIVDYKDIHYAITECFSQYPYSFKEVDNSFEDLNVERKKIVESLPLKSDIYLPTEKIPLGQQVTGLLKVADLQSKDNLKASQRRFEDLKKILNVSKRKRIFVIGNGPSITNTDLSLLKDEITIGFNGIFLHENFKPTIYMVEDHLVAEDRVNEIHDFECPVKIFPSYLAYCINPQSNVIFLNHISRVSYPVDTDFSDNAGVVSYTGGTVTYTGLQVAASLGAEEIILIGVDASYTIFKVDRSKSYGTGVLTSKEDDINHFDSRYFGKGYRWHDPNVHTMLQAYRKARDWSLLKKCKIFNATIGGELEVFPRVDYYKLFPQDVSYPKVAILDFTSIDRLSATGVIKKNLFKKWPKSSLLNVYADEKNHIVAFQNIRNDLYTEIDKELSIWPAFRSLIEYSPDVMYIRPTHDRDTMTIFQVVTSLLLKKPYVVHYMDDWLFKLRKLKTADQLKSYEIITKYLFEKSTKVLSICDKMSDYLQDVHSIPRNKLKSIHNYLQVGFEFNASKSKKEKIKNGRALKIIKYFGGLEPDMGLATLVKVSNQISAYNLSQKQFFVEFEIYTSRNYINKFSGKFVEDSSTTFHEQMDSYDEYINSLSFSDLNLISYNFDDDSVAYVKYSMANKLPELIGVKVPFLAIGPSEVGTINLLKNSAYPFLICEEELNLGTTLDKIFNPAVEVVDAYLKSTNILRDEFSEHKNRVSFQNILREVNQVGVIENEFEKDANLMVRNMLVLINDQNKQKIIKDLDIFIRLPLLPTDLINLVINRVQTHGLTWSIRAEFDSLKSMVNNAVDLGRADKGIQALAIAILICGFGIDRYAKINDVVRAWILLNFNRE
jgi:hypothetical protein